MGQMMDLRILLPALLLVFGLATVFAQTSAPAKGKRVGTSGSVVTEKIMTDQNVF